MKVIRFVLEEIEMRENNENIVQETEAAFTLAVLLLNFLILAALTGLVWSLKFLLSPESPLGMAFSETVWR